MKTEALMTKCFYRVNHIHCDGGKLFQTNNEPSLLEGTSVYCPACDGKGMILTEKGREFLTFLMKFGRPFLRDVVDELFEEREQHG